MIYRIDENTASIKTIDEIAQDLRQFCKHVADVVNEENRDGFEYACEVFEKKLNEKVDELRPIFPDFEPWEIEGREVAPWKCYAGNTLCDGDWILHPSGERGRVTVVEGEEELHKRWRVKYEDVDVLLPLGLQIDDRGQAVKIVKTSGGSEC